ncbi:MAG: muramoyltetrapeptide carboxypeptidase [Acidobacteriota bacterium]|nr:muramoyltetrapeptide carboxypeptidase [Acidobacteriota bacterium]
MILPRLIPKLAPPAGPSDRVGVAALSGPVDPEKLAAGVESLRRLGFEPVLADNVLSRRGFLAGGDEERLAAFHKLAADPDLPAIFFTRGGYGLMRILPALDWDLLARHPRAYVGYSDLTPFLMEIVRRLGLVAFHGPLVAGELARGLDPEEEASLLGALAGRYPVEQPFHGWLREGSASGPLLGGCLSLLSATVGTPWFPDLRGAIVFWEEINEAPYRVDRMLTHLRLSGNLEGIAGMIVGHVAGKEEWSGWPALVNESLSGFSWPLAWGLPAGHVPPNWTLPLGLPARLDAGSLRMVIGE